MVESRPAHGTENNDALTTLCKYMNLPHTGQTESKTLLTIDERG